MTGKLGLKFWGEKFAVLFSALLVLVVMLSSGCSPALSEKGQLLPHHAANYRETVSISNDRVTISFSLPTGLISFAARGREVFEGAFFGALINGEEWVSSQFTWEEWSKITIADALGHGNSLIVISTENRGIRWVLEITLYEGKDYAIFQHTLTNTGQQAVKVGGLKPLAVEANGKFSRDFSLRGAVVFINGYTSVGYRGVVPVLPVPHVAIPGSLPDGTGNLRFGDYSGWWVHALWIRNRGIGFIAGALTAEKWKTFIDLRQNLLTGRISSWSVNNLGDALLPPGQAFASEKIMIGVCTNPLTCLDEYGAAVGKVNQVKPAPASLGWCSWPYYYRKITETEVLRNAAFMKERLSPAYKYVLIDSGWFTFRGDWKANEKFPEGMKATAQKIRNLGLRPGLWFAPFLVDKGSALLHQHPDWFVKNEDGSLYVYKQDPGAPERYVLDGSHPEVQAWLEKLFSTVVNEWGYEYLKLDFLQAGAVEGKRYNPAVTSLEALRQGLRAIRRGAGDKTYIQQAIGPWLAPVGILNESRMGMDTEFRLSAGLTTSDIPWLNWQYATWYIRNNIAGYFARGNLFNVQSGEGIRLGPWSLQETKTLLATYALNGNLWLAGDLTALSPEQIDLLNNEAIIALSTSNLRVKPADLFERPDFLAAFGAMNVFGDSQRLTYGNLPTVWYAPVEGSLLVGLFNWGDRRTTVTLPLAKIGLDPDRRYSFFDLWTGQKVGEYRGSITIPIDAHSHMLLRIE
ncbi:MAG: alpha-galactosidase [Anaerolineae bacterium]|nr:alpha-galactosidase [Anaerolineae bacterium]MDW8101762.1 alpha-galactosidase [Anaerolineae bacterium]